MRSRVLPVLAFLGLAAGTFMPGSQVHADEPSPYSVLNFSSQPDAGPDWIVTVGVGTQYGPTYEGASKTSVTVLPSDFDIRRAGEAPGWGAPDDAFSFSVFESHGFAIGPAADFRGGRSRSDERDLTGVHTVPATLDAGLFMEYWLIENQLRARVEVRQALRAGQGLVAGLNAAAAALGSERVVLDRADSYLGVMIDDLVLQGVTEPYRMLTARAEFRLRLRADNAETRLTPISAQLGCLGAARRERLVRRSRDREAIAAMLAR